MGLLVKDDGWRIPDEVWERMEPLLPPRPPHPLGCHNPRVPDRAAMDAILLVARTGMQWERAQRDRDLLLELGPPPLPGVGAGRGVRGVLATRAARLRGAEGDRLGVALLRRGARQGAARRRGDRPQPHGQSKKGAKRSLVCEGSGVPVGLEIAGANVNDFKLLEGTLGSILIERPEPSAESPQGLCLDKGYDYPEVYELALEHGFTPHVRERGEEAERKRREPSWRAGRWVVERTHSWLNRFRGLLIRWSKKPQNHRALLQLACGLITWRTATAEDRPG